MGSGRLRQVDVLMQNSATTVTGKSGEWQHAFDLSFLTKESELQGGLELVGLSTSESCWGHVREWACFAIHTLPDKTLPKPPPGGKIMHTDSTPEGPSTRIK